MRSRHPVAFQRRWRGLVEGHVTETRKVLDAALADRLTFSREADGTWTISMPLAWHRVLERLSPEAFSGLQESVASPNGRDDAFLVPLAAWFAKRA